MVSFRGNGIAMIVALNQAAALGQVSALGAVSIFAYLHGRPRCI